MNGLLASTGAAEESSLLVSSSDQTLQHSTTGMHVRAKLTSGGLPVVCLDVVAERGVGQRATAEVVHKRDQRCELVVINAGGPAVDTVLVTGQVLSKQLTGLSLTQWWANLTAVMGVTRMAVTDGSDAL